jgi:hypothetical protein
MAQANNATLDIINSVEMDDYRQSRLQTYGANFSSFILDSIDPNGAQGKTRGNQTHLLSNSNAHSCTRTHRYQKGDVCRSLVGPAASETAPPSVME